MAYIGTAGYSYKDWIGPFYPESTKDTQMLEYYSMFFSFVEVNSSYYHMPSLKLFESMNKKTPDDFKFSVKLFGGFTHERNIGKIEADKFKYSVKPLAESGKLACLLAQFPYSFHYSMENVEYLSRLREMFCEFEINIEFRNQNWVKNDVFTIMKNENMGFVCVDVPGIKGLIKNVIANTSKVAYLRLHGRNAAKWYAGEGSERYDYLYSTGELLEWVNRIHELEAGSGMTFVSFNNHPMGKAIQNAKMLTSLLL